MDIVAKLKSSPSFYEQIKKAVKNFFAGKTDDKIINPEKKDCNCEKNKNFDFIFFE